MPNNLNQRSDQTPADQRANQARLASPKVKSKYLKIAAALLQEDSVARIVARQADISVGLSSPNPVQLGSCDILTILNPFLPRLEMKVSRVEHLTE